MYYIGYGSNFKEAQVKERTPNARFVCIACIHDKQVVFRGNDEWGYYADLIDKSGSKAVVAVYEFSEADFALMDKYERVAEGCYHRESCPVVLRSGEEVDGILYKMNENKGFHVGQPRDEYVGRLAYGFIDKGIGLNVLEALLNYNRAEMLAEGVVV